MAIRKRSDRKRPYLVYWRSPQTGRIEGKSFFTLREAREYESEIKHRLEFKPESFGVDRDTGTVPTTFSSLAIIYLRKKQFASKNERDTIYHLKAIMPTLGSLTPEEISRPTLRLLVMRLEDRGLKQNGIHRKMSIVKAILSWAENEELIEVNHAKGFKCPRGEDAKVPPPTPAEIERILAVAPEHLMRAVTLAFYLGVRVGPGELFNLRWENFDFERGKVMIHCAQKNLKVPWREIDLHSSLLPLLTSWRTDGNEHVIHHKGKPVITLKRPWHKALEEAGITRPIRPYDMRHSFATYALEGGADIKAVSEIMGHADTTMIHKHYQHVLNSQKRAAINALPTLKSGHTAGHTESPIQPSFCMTEEKKD
jgi:integrase